jgi:2-polyprenyl-3-methyl-5-hydroxy-6-metoxy-1,4-benzoquinol methylase
MQMKIDTLENCPACLSKQVQKYTDIQDFYFSKEIFEINTCRNCGLKFTQNRPSESEIGKYYDSENYASHDSEKEKSLFSLIYKIARNFMLDQKFKLVRQFKPEWKKVLDYGTGEGYLTEYLIKKGKDAEGIEPSNLARENFFKRTGKHLYPNLQELPSEKKFDVISLWHVLEHIHQLHPTIDHLISHMEKTGILVIAVPNQKSKDCAEFGNYWAAWDVPRHLYHWNIESLSKFFNQKGLKKIYTSQLPLDPFYIGIVSAKYMQKSPLEGLIKGFQSYFHGRNYPEQGSTLLTIWMKS